MDPIPPGAQPRYIYSYSIPGEKVIAEVRKARTKRTARRQDYFETSKLAEGMARMPTSKIGEAYRVKTRWKPVPKNVLYIDFRAELPAYEKFMQHPSGREAKRDLEERKEWVRTRSRKVREALDQGSTDELYYGVRKVHQIVELSKESVADVSRILGRVYDKIRMIQHDYFERSGWTIELSSADRTYSEAYAGSGEFAIVVMVQQIASAQEKSLILLDEPETSLHPASQQKLMDFLFCQSLKRKHQIVFATHSPHMVRPLPDDAIKLLTLDPVTGKVLLDRQSNSQTDAFFRLGAPIANRLSIFVEDRLAGAILNRALRDLGEAITNQIDIQTYPGGADGIIKRLIPQLAQTGNNSSLVFLDGDMIPIRPEANPAVDGRNFMDPSLVLDQDLFSCFGSYFNPGPSMELAVNGSQGTRSSLSDSHERKKVLTWVYRDVNFLPGLSPEEVLCSALGIDVLDSSEAKAYFVELTRKDLGFEEREAININSDDVFQTQRRAIASIDFKSGAWESLREHVRVKMRSFT